MLIIVISITKYFKVTAAFSFETNTSEKSEFSDIKTKDGVGK